MATPAEQNTKASSADAGMPTELGKVAESAQGRRQSGESWMSSAALSVRSEFQLVRPPQQWHDGHLHDCEPLGVAAQAIAASGSTSCSDWASRRCAVG